MTPIEADEKLKKYNYLVGKTIGKDTIAAIMPVPVDSEMTVEQMFLSVFNNVPHKLFEHADYRIVVMLNYQQFLDKGEVIWKDLNEVLEMLGINE